jgi:hypothetical protein
MDNNHDLLSSPSKKATRNLKSLLKRGRKFVRRTGVSFQTTESEAVSETSGVKLSTSSPFPLDKTLGDASDSNGNDLVHMRRDSESNATNRVNHVCPARELSFSLKSVSANDLKANDHSSNDFLTAGKHSLKRLLTPLKNLRINSRYSMPRADQSSRRSMYSRSSRRSASRKSGEEDFSENEENFDLSYSIMPRMSVRNIDTGSLLQDKDFCNALDESERQMGLLAESRTPSFNVMLHANDFYSDSCTLLKRKTVRISWEDLASNTKKTERDELDETEDLVPDIGGRRISDMTFQAQDHSTGQGRVVFGVQRMRTRGSLLVRQPSNPREGANKGGMPLWSGTSTINFTPDFGSFVLYEKTKDWLKHFKTCDPRHQILKFFNDVANEGATGDSLNFSRDHISPLLKYLYRSSVFTVWRPTSLQSIRRMMLGEGVGKGLDIKGKSAKRGKLSAFVPFLQIFKEEDKAKVRILPKNGKIRIFFTSERARDLVVTNLNELAKELEETVRAAKNILEDESKHDEETIENAMAKTTLDIKDPTINTIDTYISSNKYGIKVPERLFWEGMVIRQNIYRKAGSEDDIGRTSMPSFQDMNFASLRKPRNEVPGGHTRAVILQYNPPGEEENNPMNPLNLLMAYEENDPDNDRCRVIPVVSDFDAFIVGTRGVKYEEEVPEDQIEVLKWMVEQTESILDTPSKDSWTKQWLNVLKDSGNKGYHPKMPTGGYSDPKTRVIFNHAINRLSTTGAVRHGAECYNYSFPQELDDEVLVISDDLPDQYKGSNWVYVNQDELKDILKFKIDNGYTFPLSPKWILCDLGWKEVYDKLLASKKMNVQPSLDCFYPPESGIRELIEKIYKKHPDGFHRQQGDTDTLRQKLHHSKSVRLSSIDGTIAMDLAQQELKYYFILKRAKNRLRAFLKMKLILNSIREESEEGDDLDHKEEGEPRVIETEIEEGDDLDHKEEGEPRVIETEIEEGDDLDREEDEKSRVQKMSRVDRFE